MISFAHLLFNFIYLPELFFLATFIRNVTYKKFTLNLLNCCLTVSYQFPFSAHHAGAQISRRAAKPFSTMLHHSPLPSYVRGGSRLKLEEVTKNFCCKHLFICHSGLLRRWHTLGPELQVVVAHCAIKAKAAKEKNCRCRCCCCNWGESIINKP